jgi:hypothetical protein
MEKEFKKLNLRADNDKVLSIQPDSIPTLVPADSIKQWMDGDADPYYKIQKIDFPLVANGYNYTADFFKSFVSKLNRAPIPGSKLGHETSWGKRGTTDLLLVGAEVKENKNGKGSVFLKMYIPPVGESGDNAVFIKENKTQMVDYSLVSYTKDERIENPDGTVTWNVIESRYGERNDAVGYGEGAMQQKTNSADNDITIQGEGMEKKEILKALKTLKTNLEITLPEIASELGLGSLLITDEQNAAVNKMNAVQKLIGDRDPVEYIKELQSVVKQNADEVRAAKFNEVFGVKVFEDTKKENKARTYAEKIIGDDELTEEKINEVKEDEIYKSLAAERADVDSDANRIGISDNDKPKSNVAEY